MEPSWGHEVLASWFFRRPGEDVLETDLLKEFFPEPLAEGVGLALFQRHFLLLRRLWQLDDELRRTTGQRLWIRGIRFTLLAPPPVDHCGWLDTETGRYCEAPGGPLCDRHSGTSPVDNSTKSYYLDSKNLEGMTEEGLQSLMDSFFLAWERRDALEVLGLPADADEPSVKARWRKLSLDHHPDRGGDPAEFQRLNAAMVRWRRSR